MRPYQLAQFVERFLGIARGGQGGTVSRKAAVGAVLGRAGGEVGGDATDSLERAAELRGVGVIGRERPRAEPGGVQ
jgi:hypothetical protein